MPNETNSYKVFMKRGVWFFMAAVIVVVLVFVGLQFLLYQPTGNPPSPEPNETGVESISTDPDAFAGMYLRDLPLSEPQRSYATAAGFDVETQYVTKEAMACAAEAIGAGRLATIRAGDTPTYVESVQLVKCL